MSKPRTAVLLVLIVVPLAALAAGCGDDDKPKGFSTGVDGNTPLGAASATEAGQICRATDNWARQQLADAKRREVACRLGAVTAAAAGALLPGAAGGTPNINPVQLQSTCRLALDQCLAVPPPSTTPSMATCQQLPANCMATVAQYEACVNDLPPFLDKTAATLPTCETLSPLALLSLASLLTTVPASCQTFQMKCGLSLPGGIPGIPGVPGLGPTPTGGTTTQP